jgi:hypothetical protein
MSAPLTLEAIRTIAPAVFATKPKPGVSGRYTFLPTADIIEDLAVQGFLPAEAKQSRARSADGGSYAAHSIRFRHESLWGDGERSVGDAFPEIVLSNAHDTSAIYRLEAGIFRKVCGNGLVVTESSFGSIAIRHAGNDDARKRILDATYTIAAHAKDVLTTIEGWKAIPVTLAQQLAIAGRAIELKGNLGLQPGSLLDSRRKEDNANEDGSRDLWTAFNTIQENVIRGGVGYTAPSGRRVSTRAINSVSSGLAVNRGLWQIASEFAQAI